jgi:hypothetical protein
MIAISTAEYRQVESVVCSCVDSPLKSAELTKNCAEALRRSEMIFADSKALQQELRSRTTARASKAGLN